MFRTCFHSFHIWIFAQASHIKFRFYSTIKTLRGTCFDLEKSKIKNVNVKEKQNIIVKISLNSFLLDFISNSLNHDLVTLYVGLPHPETRVQEELLVREAEQSPDESRWGVQVTQAVGEAAVPWSSTSPSPRQDCDQFCNSKSKT